MRPLAETMRRDKNGRYKKKWSTRLKELLQAIGAVVVLGLFGFILWSANEATNGAVIEAVLSLW